MIYGIPIAISALVADSLHPTFRRRAISVLPRCSASSARASHPTCPLQQSGAARWPSASSAGTWLRSYSFLPLLPFLPAGIPAYLFRPCLSRTRRHADFTCSISPLLVIPALGLLLLKRWSYPLTIASQLLVLRQLQSPRPLVPSYEQIMRRMLSTDEPARISSSAPTKWSITSATSATFGLLIPVAILIALTSANAILRCRETRQFLISSSSPAAIPHALTQLPVCTFSFAFDQPFSRALSHALRARCAIIFVQAPGGSPQLLTCTAVPPSSSLFSFALRRASSSLAASGGLLAIRRPLSSGHCALQGDLISG